MSRSQATSLSKYQILAIVVLALTQFTVVLDFMVMSPLGDSLKKSLELNPKQFGIVVAAYAYSAGISGFLTAGFADRFDRKKLLLVFYIGFILGTLLCGLSSSYGVLVFARIVTGIFGGVISSISLAIVADVFAADQRGRVIGFLQMGFGVAQIAGIPVSLILAGKWGWQAPFIMIVVLGLLIWLTASLKLQPITAHLSKQTKENPILHLWRTLRNRQYRMGYLATAFLSLGGWMIMPWGSIYPLNNLKISSEQLTLLYLIGGVTTLIIMPLIGIISDRVSRMLIFASASMWMIVTVLIYVNLQPGPFWILAGVNMLMMIGIMSRMVPSNAMITSIPELHDRGAFMSINSSLQQITGGVGSTISSWIVYQKTEESPLEHFSVLGIVVACVIFMNIFFMWRVNNMVQARSAMK